jgi:hypothetical protein
MEKTKLIKKSVKYITTNSYLKNKSFTSLENLLKYVEENNIFPELGNKYLKYKKITTEEYSIIKENLILPISLKEYLFHKIKNNLFVTGGYLDLMSLEKNKYNTANSKNDFLLKLIYWHIFKKEDGIDPDFINKLIDRITLVNNISSTEFFNILKNHDIDKEKELKIYTNIRLIKFIFEFVEENNKYENLEFYTDKCKNVILTCNLIDIYFDSFLNIIPIRYDRGLNIHNEHYDGKRTKLNEKHLEKILKMYRAKNLHNR